jgi:hypothetical protein
MTLFEFLLIVIGSFLTLLWFGWVFIVFSKPGISPPERISPPEGGQPLIPRSKQK